MQSLRLKFLVATFMTLAVVFAGGSGIHQLVSIFEGESNIAAVSTDPGGGDVSTDPGGGRVSTDPINGGRDGGTTSLTNPLKSDSIVDFLLTIIEVILVFAVPIIVLFIMYAGFLYVTAAGDESKIKKAHSALTWAIVGGVIVLGSKLIIDVIQGTVEAL